ncbi:hypothetical protein BJY52DRAFT_1389457 [Lactarius psammicola]|nr:hypothetical protein BJY52DRAFT_1389457 [Lactarius psammicola]
MSISVSAFLSYLLLVGSARAQTFNSLQQNPCLVTAYLAAVCNNGTFAILALLSQHSYTGPSGIDNGDICKCNTVVYNLISACDACQGEPWIPYSMWSFNCTTTETPGTFPDPVPAGTRVPRWAYIDTSIGGSWNISAAQLIGDFPEVTGTAYIIPTSTSKAAQSNVASSTSSSSTPTPHHSPNTSAIVGGTFGGVIGVTLIAGVVLWFAIRRRRARSVPSAPYLDFQGGEKDPSDPTTYPSKEYLPVSNQRLGSTSHLRPNNCGYSGLPEI